MPAAASGVEIVSHRRRYSEDDLFFVDGNMSRVGTMTCLPITEQETTEDALGATFPCSMPYCKQRFSSLKEFDKHLFHAHYFKCATCGRDFNTARLLDLHITEKHDSYWAARLSRELSKEIADQEPLYDCIVEGCKHKSLSNNKRNHHLVEDHCFPKDERYQRNKNKGSVLYKKEKKKSEENKMSTVRSEVVSEMNDIKVHGEGDDMELDEVMQGMSALKVVVPANLSFGGRGRGRGMGRGKGGIGRPRNETAGRGAKNEAKNDKKLVQMNIE